MKHDRKERKLTITQSILREISEKLERYTHDATRKQYFRHAKHFVKFCREQFNVRTSEDCRTHLQDYSDALQSQNYSASTIHTYLAAACAAMDVKLSAIQKPIRYVADYVKGRGPTACYADSDLSNPAWAYMVDFQRCVGIRRNELRRLRGADFGIDESGKPCVIVRRGKGGKCQYQRILDSDIEFIKSYFDSVADFDFVFDRKYFRNHLNFHLLRSQVAKQYYEIQLQCLQTNPAYDKILEKEIHERWKMNRRKDGKIKKFQEREFRGIYTLRGKNRQCAIEKGYPIHYDKRALLATSIFKLTHWRNDVTIASYLLA